VQLQYRARRGTRTPTVLAASTSRLWDRIKTGVCNLLLFRTFVSVRENSEICGMNSHHSRFYDFFSPIGETR